MIRCIIQEKRFSERKKMYKYQQKEGYFPSQHTNRRYFTHHTPHLGGGLARNVDKKGYFSCWWIKRERFSTPSALIYEPTPIKNLSCPHIPRKEGKFTECGYFLS